MNSRMTESESVALPLGDTPISEAVLPLISQIPIKRLFEASTPIDFIILHV